MKPVAWQPASAFRRMFRHARVLVAALACLFALAPCAAIARTPLENPSLASKIHHADRRRGDAYAQLEAAYALLAAGDRRASAYLRRAATLQPTDARIHEQLGYTLLAEGNLTGAVAAFRAALALNPENEQVRMQLVYAEDSRGKHRAATREAAAVVRQRGARAQEACRAYHNIAGLPDRIMPKPWFAEFYFAPEYRTRGYVGVVPAQLRVGYSFIGEDVLSAYVSLRATRDNRSGGTGVGSQVFFDNSLVIAGGLRLRPWDGAPIFAFIEQGGAEDLVSQGRNRWRSDTRAGIVAGQEWEMAPRECPGELVARFVPIADFYAEAIWYSRYDNMIGFARIRPGLRLLESDNFAFEAYGLAAINFDTAGKSDNRFREVGAGIALKFYQPLRTALRAEIVNVSRSGQSSIVDRRIRLEQEFRF